MKSRYKRVTVINSKGARFSDIFYNRISVGKAVNYIFWNYDLPYSESYTVESTPVTHNKDIRELANESNSNLSCIDNPHQTTELIDSIPYTFTERQ